MLNFAHHQAVMRKLKEDEAARDATAPVRKTAKAPTMNGAERRRKNGVKNVSRVLTREARTTTAQERRKREVIKESQ